MRFMMMIHHGDVALGAAPRKEVWSEYAAFNEALAKATGCADVRGYLFRRLEEVSHG